MLAIIAAMTMLAIPIAIDEAHAEPQADVVHIEGRSYLFSAGIDGEVTWDFGDGTVVRSSEAVAHSFPSSGLWTVTVTDSSRTYDLQVMIIDQSPPTKCYTGSEYHWAPGGEVTYATAADMTTGVAVAWLSWDASTQTLRGIPPESAVGKTYLVRAIVDGVGVAYDLKVIAGYSTSLSAEFVAKIEGLKVTLTPIHSPNLALWYWTMYDMDGVTVSIGTGPSPVLTAPAEGDYVIRASLSTSFGSAEYSRAVYLTEITPDDPSGQSPYAMYGVAIFAIIALLLAVRFLL